MAHLSCLLIVRFFVFEILLGFDSRRQTTKVYSFSVPYLLACVCFFVAATRILSVKQEQLTSLEPECQPGQSERQTGVSLLL